MAGSEHVLFPSGSFVAPVPQYDGKELFRRFLSCWARGPQKIHIIRIGAPLSRQPLVKGERLVRFEVSAAIPRKVAPDILYSSPHPNRPVRRLSFQGRLESSTEAVCLGF